MKRKIIIIFLAFMLVLLPVQAFAQDCNTVKSGTIDDVSGTFPQLNIVQKLVRWIDGTLWTAIAVEFGLHSQIRVYYSVDNGLNWVPSYTTSGGGAYNPTLATSSNYDLCLLYLNDNSVTWDVKGAMYDASTGTWTSDGVIYTGDNVQSIAIDVGSDDTFHAAYFRNQGSCFDDIDYMTRTYQGGGIWNSWAVQKTVTDVCQPPVGIAVSQEDDVCIVFGGSMGGGTDDVTSCTYDESLDSWSEQTIASTQTNLYPTVMATIRGGVTYWIAAWIYRLPGTSDTVYIAEKTGAGAWSGGVSVGIGHSPGDYSNGRPALAQEQSAAGTTDTGNFFALYNESDGSIEYNEYEVGTGLLGADTISCNTGVLDGIYATKSLYPYDLEVGWHWNLQADDFAMTYYDQGADSGYDDGDELIRYWDSASSWGSFSLMVETLDPTNITATTATFNGEILMTGGANPTEIGWQYGFTQTATWTESQSGNFTVDTYSAAVTGLEGDEIYYVRFYATNSEGTNYGEWVGFLTAQQGSDQPDEPDDGMLPPVPTEAPGGWIIHPDDKTFDTWPFSDLINTFADMVSRSFVWFLLTVATIVGIGLLITRYTRHLGIVFLTLGVVLGIFISGQYLDWWIIFPYLIVGIALVIKEQNMGMGF